MVREIFVVNAAIVDANGTYNLLSGYPKTFDSKNYQDDVEKAKKRAEGDWHEVMGAYAKRDDRLLQTAYVLQMSNGAIIQNGHLGTMNTADPEPEPEE